MRADRQPDLLDGGCVTRSSKAYSGETSSRSTSTAFRTSRNGPSLQEKTFEQLALAISADGTSIKVLQYEHGAWLPHEDKPGLAVVETGGTCGGENAFNFLRVPVHDWVTDNGPDNFEKWIGA